MDTLTLIRVRGMFVRHERRGIRMVVVSTGPHAIKVSKEAA